MKLTMVVCVIRYGPNTRRRQRHPRPHPCRYTVGPGWWRMSESEELPPSTENGTVLYAVNQKVIYERCCTGVVQCGCGALTSLLVASITVQ
jgi:hypothetical protein